MRKTSSITLLVFSIPAIAGQTVPLPDDEWQPLTQKQAESVCVYEKPQRPYMDHKMHDTTDKKRKECIEKTRKYGLVGKDFIGLTGQYREEKAVRERQLDLEREAAAEQPTPATSEQTMAKPSTPSSAPPTTTRGGTSTENQQLDELMKRLEKLEQDNAELRQELDKLKEN